MSSKLDALEAEVEKLSDIGIKSGGSKYHRSQRFGHKVTPNWSSMPHHIKANTSKRTSLLITWCDRYCQDAYSYDGVKVGFSFVSAKDATLFKMTWG